jgi:hypothetical protein
VNLPRCFGNRPRYGRYRERSGMLAWMLNLLRWPGRRRGGRSGLHPPRRFRVYADLIAPLPDAETTPVVRPAVPVREDGEG